MLKPGPHSSTDCTYKVYIYKGSNHTRYACPKGHVWGDYDTDADGINNGSDAEPYIFNETAVDPCLSAPDLTTGQALYSLNGAPTTEICVPDDQAQTLCAYTYTALEGYVANDGTSPTLYENQGTWSSAGACPAEGAVTATLVAQADCALYPGAPGCDELEPDPDPDPDPEPEPDPSGATEVVVTNPSLDVNVVNSEDLVAPLNDALTDLNDQLEALDDSLNPDPTEFDGATFDSENTLTFSESVGALMTRIESSPLVGGISSLTLPSGTSCPTFSFPWLDGSSIVMSVHCDILSDPTIAGLIYAMALVLFSISGVRIVLSA
ncbi:MAG: hypothetical protein AAF417_21895 [Pseudomonadota bacterium]